MRNWKQGLLTLALALGAMIPAGAQTGFPFVIRVEQNGRAFTVNNGATVTMNSPATGTRADGGHHADLHRHNAGNDQQHGSERFAGVQHRGFGQHGAVAGAIDRLDVVYVPETIEGALAQLSLPFLIDVTNSTPASGIVLLSLAGTVPSFAVSYLQPVDNNTVFVPSGGTIQFPQSLVNGAIDAQLNITNRGSGTGRITAISLEGAGFLLVGVPLLPVTLPAGSELRLTLRFLPRTAGTSTAVLRAGFEGSSFTANVSGEALRSFFSYELIKDGAVTPLEPGSVELSWRQ